MLNDILSKLILDEITAHDEVKHVLEHVCNKNGINLEVENDVLDLFDSLLKQIQSLSAKVETRNKLYHVLLLAVVNTYIPEAVMSTKVSIFFNTLSIFVERNLNVKKLVKNSELERLIIATSSLYYSLYCQQLIVVRSYIEYDIKTSINILQERGSEAKCFLAVSIIEKIAISSSSSLIIEAKDAIVESIYALISTSNSWISSKACNVLHQVLILLLTRIPTEIDIFINSFICQVILDYENSLKDFLSKKSHGWVRKISVTQNKVGDKDFMLSLLASRMEVMVNVLKALESQGRMKIIHVLPLSERRKISELFVVNLPRFQFNLHIWKQFLKLLPTALRNAEILNLQISEDLVFQLVLESTGLYKLKTNNTGISSAALRATAWKTMSEISSLQVDNAFHFSKYIFDMIPDICKYLILMAENLQDFEFDEYMVLENCLQCLHQLLERFSTELLDCSAIENIKVDLFKAILQFNFTDLTFDLVNLMLKLFQNQLNALLLILLNTIEDSLSEIFTKIHANLVQHNNVQNEMTPWKVFKLSTVKSSRKIDKLSVVRESLQNGILLRTRGYTYHDHLLCLKFLRCECFVRIKNIQRRICRIVAVCLSNITYESDQTLVRDVYRTAIAVLENFEEEYLLRYNLAVLAFDISAQFRDFFSFDVASMSSFGLSDMRLSSKEKTKILRENLSFGMTLRKWHSEGTLNYQKCMWNVDFIILLIYDCIAHVDCDRSDTESLRNIIFLLDIVPNENRQFPKCLFNTLYCLALEGNSLCHIHDELVCLLLVTLPSYEFCHINEKRILNLFSILQEMLGKKLSQEKKIIIINSLRYLCKIVPGIEQIWKNYPLLGESIFYILRYGREAELKAAVIFSSEFRNLLKSSGYVEIPTSKSHVLKSMLSDNNNVNQDSKVKIEMNNFFLSPYNEASGIDQNFLSFYLNEIMCKIINFYEEDLTHRGYRDTINETHIVCLVDVINFLQQSSNFIHHNNMISITCVLLEDLQKLLLLTNETMESCLRVLNPTCSLLNFLLDKELDSVYENICSLLRSFHFHLYHYKLTMQVLIRFILLSSPYKICLHGILEKLFLAANEQEFFHVRVEFCKILFHIGKSAVVHFEFCLNNLMAKLNRKNIIFSLQCLCVLAVANREQFSTLHLKEIVNKIYLLQDWLVTQAKIQRRTYPLLDKFLKTVLPLPTFTNNEVFNWLANFVLIFYNHRNSCNASIFDKLVNILSSLGINVSIFVLYRLQLSEFAIINQPYVFSFFDYDICVRAEFSDVSDSTLYKPEIDMQPILQQLSCWIIPENTSKDFWNDWFSRIELELVVESPLVHLRKLSNISRIDKDFRETLFNVSFLIYWKSVHNLEQQKIVNSLQRILEECREKNVIHKVVQLFIFLDKVGTPIPLDVRMLSKQARKNSLVESSLFYTERQFQRNTLSNLKDIFQIFTQLGLTSAKQVILFDSKVEDPDWYYSIKAYKKALKLYSSRLKSVRDDLTSKENSTNIYGLLLCLQKLGFWNLARHISKHWIDLSCAIEDKFGNNKVWRKSTTSFYKAFVDITSLDCGKTHLNLDAKANSLTSNKTCISKKIKDIYLSLSLWKLPLFENVAVFSSLKVGYLELFQEKNYAGAVEVAEKSLTLLTSELAINEVSLVKGLYEDKLLRVQQWAGLKDIAIHSQNPFLLSKARLSSITSTIKIEDDESLASVMNLSLSSDPQQFNIAVLRYLRDCAKHENMFLAIRLFSLLGFKVDSETDSLLNMSHLSELIDKTEILKFSFLTDFAKKSDFFDAEISLRKKNILFNSVLALADYSWELGYYEFAVNRWKRILTCLNSKIIQNCQDSPQRANDLRVLLFDPSTDYNSQISCLLTKIAQCSLQFDVSEFSWSSVLECYENRANGLCFSLKDSRCFRRTLFSASVKHDPANHTSWRELAKIYIESAQECTDTSVENSVEAIKALVQSVCLSSSKKTFIVQDLLRVLVICFKNQNVETTNEVILSAMNSIPAKYWLFVIPQLIARISSSFNFIPQLLVKVGEVFPQEITYPLLVAINSSDENKCKTVNNVLQAVSKHSFEVVEQIRLFCKELVRVSSSWREKSILALENAAHQYFVSSDKINNMKYLLDVVYRLFKSGSSTLDEAVFYQNHFRKMEDAQLWISNLKDIDLNSASNHRSFKAYLNQAWDQYHNCFQLLLKEENELNLTLSFVSPKLSSLENAILRVPVKKNEVFSKVRINKVYQSIEVLKSKQHPRKLRLQGSDGICYQFLLKGNEDLRLDERVMQVFNLMNSVMAENDSKAISIQFYTIIPLSSSVGLIEYLPNVSTISCIIREYRKRFRIPVQLELDFIREQECDYETKSLFQKLEIFEEVQKLTQSDELKNFFWISTINARDWFKKRANYSKTLSITSIVGYLIGLGDRHPSNIMIKDDGSIVHIDFGDSFEISMKRPQFPETVPFRLTRMFINALEIKRTEGMFKNKCIDTLSLLKMNKETINVLLEAFVQDPLMQWKIYTSNKDDILLSKEVYDENISENEFIANIIKRVSSKLDGRDGCLDSDHGVQQDLEIATQVGRLIQISSSKRELCRLYLGWCPHW